MQEISPGIYRHHKGSEYEVLYVATHTESGERLVIYRETGGGEFWARPVAMFLQTVDVEGQQVPRFEKIR